MKNIYFSISILSLFALSSFNLNGQCIGSPGEVTWQIWKDLPYYGIEHLFVEDTYPTGPDDTKKIGSISTITNYDDMFGSVIKGYISVPETGSVTFNVTGDDYTEFKLSTDDTPQNLVTMAYVTDWSGRTEYNKYPEQTSAPIILQQGNHYYFELYNREGGGGDHATVHWQRPFQTDSTWLVVSSQFLNDICDDNYCPSKETTCDDNNSNTVNDMEDGFCNCVGQPPVGSLPVGNRGELEAYFYENISGGSLTDLFNDPDYPYAPDSVRIHKRGLFTQWLGYDPDYGVLIKGFLTVPETGSYDFNITGTNNTRFTLSSDATPNGTLDSIQTVWGTDVLEHNHPSFGTQQTMTGKTLNANTYYYFELKQKEVDWGHRFSVFWNGPQHSDQNWKKIPEMFVYNYLDPVICLPLGSPCDDGNPLTANDEIKANCLCEGVPCTAFVDCDDPESNYIKYDYCETTDELGTRADDFWLSCQPVSDHPVSPSYNGDHWIHYNLGDEYELNGTHVWNYNVPGELNRGFRNVTVHYSLDNINWDLLGSYTWELANGNNNYSGFTGPDFGGVPARYVVFTDVNLNPSCRGIGKITFDITYCRDQGTPCDDGDISTYQDHFDDKCQCIGYTLQELDCAVDTLFLNEDDLSPINYHAVKSLISSGDVLNNTDVNYKAGVEIILNAGFEVTAGSSFEAAIEGCPVPIVLKNKKSEEKFKERKVRPEESLDIFKYQDNSIQIVRMYIPKATSLSLQILDKEGNDFAPIIKHRYDNYGDHYKRIQTKKLEPGIYFVKMNTEKGSYIEKMTVL